jgi:hypothetical protein
VGVVRARGRKVAAGDEALAGATGLKV